MPCSYNHGQVEQVNPPEVNDASIDSSLFAAVHPSTPSTNAAEPQLSRYYMDGCQTDTAMPVSDTTHTLEDWHPHI